jgi:hypothetical protein
LAAAVHAQDRHDQGSNGSSLTMQITFGNTPHWSSIRGTRVREIRDRERPDYDMFRYGGNYYVYNNDRWYMSRAWRGQFMLIDDRNVPYELSMIPRGHWRSYPTVWMDRQHESRSGRHGQHDSSERGGQSKGDHDHH